MIPVSGDFIYASSGTHDEEFVVQAEQENVVLFTVPVDDVSVAVDRRNQVRRTITAKLTSEDGSLIPAGASDVFNPTVGTILRAYGGPVITKTEQAEWFDDTDADFSSGTHHFTVVDGGDLLLQ